MFVTVAEELKALIAREIKSRSWYNSVSAGDVATDITPAILEKFFITWKNDETLVEHLVEAQQMYERRGPQPFIACPSCYAEMGDECTGSDGTILTRCHRARVEAGQLVVIAKVLTGKLTVTRY